MGMAKNLMDAVFLTFPVFLLIAASWSTPFGFIGTSIATPLGLLLLFLFVLCELTFVRL